MLRIAAREVRARQEEITSRHGPIASLQVGSDDDGVQAACDGLPQGIALATSSVFDPSNKDGLSKSLDRTHPQEYRGPDDTAARVLSQAARQASPGVKAMIAKLIRWSIANRFLVLWRR